MTTEEKFNAAVNVIKSLPKNGKVFKRNKINLLFGNLTITCGDSKTSYHVSNLFQ